MFTELPQRSSGLYNSAIGSVQTCSRVAKQTAQKPFKKILILERTNTINSSQSNKTNFQVIFVMKLH